MSYSLTRICYCLAGISLGGKMPEQSGVAIIENKSHDLLIELLSSAYSFLIPWYLTKTRILFSCHANAVTLP